jgi:hypothetical protein
LPKRTTFGGLIPLLDRGMLPLHRGLAFKTDMTRNLASLKNHEQFTELFELASKEQDQDKLGALFEEILCLLENQTVHVDPTQTVASALI